MKNCVPLVLILIYSILPTMAFSKIKIKPYKIISNSVDNKKSRSILVEIEFSKFPVENDLINIGKNIGKLYNIEKYEIEFRPNDFSDSNPVFAKISFSSFGNKYYKIKYIEDSLPKKLCGNSPFIWMSRMAYCFVVKSKNSLKLIQNDNKNYLKSVENSNQLLYEKLSHKNIRSRINYLEKAANNYHYEAASLLAEQYRFNDIIFNVNKAEKYALVKAKILQSRHSKGNLEATIRLSEAYKLGHGVAKNYKKSYELLFESIKFKNKDIFYQLGLIFEYGYLNKKVNKEKAKHFFKLAKKYGHTQVDKFIEAN